ncbi:MAG: hypothetical protein AAF518_10555 [Spirochaetota bacterium]
MQIVALVLIIISFAWIIWKVCQSLFANKQLQAIPIRNEQQSRQKYRNRQS